MSISIDGGLLDDCGIDILLAGRGQIGLMNTEIVCGASHLTAWPAPRSTSSSLLAVATDTPTVAGLAHTGTSQRHVTRSIAVPHIERRGRIQRGHPRQSRVTVSLLIVQLFLNLGKNERMGERIEQRTSDRWNRLELSISVTINPKSFLFFELVLVFDFQTIERFLNSVQRSKTELCEATNFYSDIHFS